MTQMPIFKNYAYFSVTSLALSDVNAREGSVVKSPDEKSALVLAESENYVCKIPACSLFVISSKLC